MGTVVVAALKTDVDAAQNLSFCIEEDEGVMWVEATGGRLFRMLAGDHLIELGHLLCIQGNTLLRDAVDVEFSLFGQNQFMPKLIGPIGAVGTHFGDALHRPFELGEILGLGEATGWEKG